MPKSIINTGKYFRDLRGHCRCYMWDMTRQCHSQCWLFHEGNDCCDFTASGQCGNKDCKLIHSEEKYKYAERQPYSSKISENVREVWQKSKLTTPFAIASVMDTDEKITIWKQIVANDSKLRMDFDSIMKLLKLAGSNWQTMLLNLERLFRINNMNTWLIARKNAHVDIEQLSKQLFGKPNMIAVKYIDVLGETRQYNLFMSVRRPEDAIRELLEESNTYTENFEKLHDCGFICVEEKK